MRMSLEYLWAMPLLRWLQASHHCGLVQSQVRPCGICGGQNGPGTDFVWVLWFLLSILIPRTALYPLIVLSLVLCAVNTDCIVKLQKERKGMLVCSVMAWNKYGYVVLWYEACFCTLVGNSDTKLIVYKDLLFQHLEAVLIFHVWNFNSKLLWKVHFS
jgi:hypothetical protein